MRRRIEYRGEVLPGYAPGLPTRMVERCEIQRSFDFSLVGRKYF